MVPSNGYVGWLALIRIGYQWCSRNGGCSPAISIESCISESRSVSASLSSFLDKPTLRLKSHLSRDLPSRGCLGLPRFRFECSPPTHPITRPLARCFYSLVEPSLFKFLQLEFYEFAQTSFQRSRTDRRGFCLEENIRTLRQLYVTLASCYDSRLTF